MEDNIDMKFSGAGVLNGGEYGKLSISGSGKLRGDVKCTEFTCSGSAKAAGNVESSGDIRCSGSFSCDGNLTAKGNVKVSGSCGIDGAVKGKDVRISGSVRAKGNISGETVSISGSVSTENDVEGETVKLYGNCKIGGILNGETVEIIPSSNNRNMEIPTVGGTDITVKAQEKEESFWNKFFGRKTFCSKLISDLIEGDTVDLSDTECKTVRGKNVVIRGNCKINRVEYSESLTVDPESTVNEQEKV